MTEYLFSYGTLQEPRVQQALFGRLLTGIEDGLAGFKLLPVEISDERFLASGEQKQQLTLVASGDAGDIVKGAAFEVSTDELHIADRYEPSGYTRFSVELKSGKRAWAYSKDR